MYKRDLIVRSNCVSKVCIPISLYLHNNDNKNINIKDNIIEEELHNSLVKSKRIEVKISNIIFYSYVKNMKGILSS